MIKERAKRNKTIIMAPDEMAVYASCCSRLTASVAAYNDILDTVIQDDALRTLKLFPDAFVDLLIVDPPYNLDKAFGSTTFKRMSSDDYRSFTERWIEAVKHTLKATASVYICCDWRTSMIIGDILGKYFTIQNRITWQREKGRGAMHNWKNSMEDIWFTTVSDRYTFNVDDVKMRRRVIAPYKAEGKPKDWTETEAGNFRDTFPSNFWDDISIPYWSMSENTDHPTQKPEKLIAKLVLASSNPGDVILDPFLGSGTTAVVAKKLDRRFVGIECEAAYCAYAQKRLKMADDNPEIQGYTDGVFWERNTLALQQKVVKQESQKNVKNLSHR